MGSDDDDLTVREFLAIANRLRSGESIAPCTIVESSDVAADLTQGFGDGAVGACAQEHLRRPATAPP